MVSFSNVKKLHCVGIKGAGLAGLACLLHARGLIVCGSDVSEEFFTDALLAKNGIPVERFSTDTITADLDMVIYSTAYEESHPEIAAARAAGIPTVSYPEALGALLAESHGIAVCGSHGKTTTTAMIAYLFHTAGSKPSALIGSIVPQLGTSALSGTGPHFIAEADEYQNKFKHYRPKTLVMTNVEYDHPDYFPTEQSYNDAFADFAGTMRGRSIIACWDDTGVRTALRGIDASHIITYGWDPSLDYWASDYHIENGRRSFSLHRRTELIGQYSLSLIGKYNASNALAALAVCDTLGIIPLDRAAHILEEFTGTARRFEYRGTFGSVQVYDDYGHHPTEIRETLHAVHHQFPGKKIWCVFGPHTFSRTQDLLTGFAHSFKHVDRVLVLDIYSSAREKTGGISGSDLSDAINAVSGNAQYVGTHMEALRIIRENVTAADVVVTMGASDVNRIADALVGITV